jgi:hypothetical protein
MNQSLTQVVLAFGDVPSYIAEQAEGPYSNAELADKWLRWVAEFSPDTIQRYDLVLVAPPMWAAPEEAAAWRNVKRFPENNRIRQWPQGPNATFKQVMWYYYYGKLSGPMFWVEADCIPVAKDWLDLVADEYKRAQKPFMGAIVEAKVDPATKYRTPRHMTGNAVYPEKAFLLAPRIMDAINIAWDVMSADQVLPKCQPTELIQHEWRHPEIRSVAELRGILRPSTALFHSDKFGAIAQLLGGELQLATITGSQTFEREPSAEVVATSSASAAGLGDFPLETILEYLAALADLDPHSKKDIARFLVARGIINKGHLMAYGKKRQGPTEAEFEKSLKNKTHALAAAN